MKQQASKEETCEDTFRTCYPDQQGGIFSHEKKVVSNKKTEAQLSDILSPAISYDHNKK